MSSDKLKMGQQIGIYALMFSMFGNAAVTPALGALQATYPDTPAFVITLIGTLPSLFIIFGALITGVVVGRFISYKALGLIALALYGITGVIPFFYAPSIEVVLVFRAICGLANGLLFPLANAAILRCVQDKDYRASYLGRAQALGSGGAILLTIFGGYLGAISGVHTFLVYALAFVCFFVVLVLFKEPPTIDMIIAKNPEYKETSINAKRVKLSAVAWVFVIFFLAYQLIRSPILMTVPLSLPPEEAGNVGLMFSLFTLGSFLIAGFTDKFVKLFGKYTAGVFLVIAAVGCALVVWSGMNIALVAIGLFILGLAIGAEVMTTFELSQLTTPAGMAFVASLAMIASNLGNFLGSFWFGWLSSVFPETQTVQLTAVIGFLILAILWSLVNIGPNKKAWAKKDETVKADAE